MTDKTSIKEILTWREERDAAVKANPRNWLTLAGLFPLHEGKNRVSSITGAEIQLPLSDKPFSAEFTWEGSAVHFHLIADPGLSINGDPPRISKYALTRTVIRIYWSGDTIF